MTVVGTVLQLAAQVAADALLAGDPAKPFDRRPLRQRAQAAIDDWEANGLASGAWKLTKAKVIARMRRLIDLPQTLNQGTLDSCAYICALFACLLRFPEETVEAARDLYERGQANLGGLRMQPNETLLAATEDMITADDSASLADRRAKEHFVPPPLDPTDWMLQVALFDSMEHRAGFTGLGRSKDGIGLREARIWAEDTGMLFRFFGPITTTTAIDVRDAAAYDKLFTDVLTKPNPQVELFLWVNQGIFPYASMSLTGNHAVVIHGRVQGSKGQTLEIPVYSYGGYEVLTADYESLRSHLQGMLAVTIKSV